MGNFVLHKTYEKRYKETNRKADKTVELFYRGICRRKHLAAHYPYQERDRLAERVHPHCVTTAVTAEKKSEENLEKKDSEPALDKVQKDEVAPSNLPSI